MDKDTIAGLKQFITVTISQQTAEVREDVDGIRQTAHRLVAMVDKLADHVAGLEDRVAEVRIRLITVEQLVGGLERRLGSLDHSLNQKLDDWAAMMKQTNNLRITSAGLFG